MNYKLVLAFCGLVVGCYAALIVFQRWIAKHIANRKKHPCSDDVVYKDVCEEVQKANQLQFKNQDDCLEKAEKRTEKRFTELKNDMQTGFTEVKDLIKGC